MTRAHRLTDRPLRRVWGPSRPLSRRFCWFSGNLRDTAASSSSRRQPEGARPRESLAGPVGPTSPIVQPALVIRFTGRTSCYLVTGRSRRAAGGVRRRLMTPKRAPPSTHRGARAGQHAEAPPVRSLPKSLGSPEGIARLPGAGGVRSPYGRLMTHRAQSRAPMGRAIATEWRHRRKTGEGWWMLWWFVLIIR